MNEKLKVGDVVVLKTISTKQLKHSSQKLVVSDINPSGVICAYYTSNEYNIQQTCRLHPDTLVLYDSLPD